MLLTLRSPGNLVQDSTQNPNVHCRFVILQNPMKKRPDWLLLLLTLLLSAQHTQASVLWKFSTTGQGQTISGTLTTDGTDADLSSAKNFNIQSIQTLLLDGAPVATLATPLPWVNGVSGNVSVGPLIWNGSSV
jgi:hypothetical protein